LTEEDLLKFITIPENALIKQYQALISSDGIELKFDDSAIKELHLSLQLLMTKL
jgi:ATP-dependent protease HslVU (ClpYQ) ATPase subunit